MEKKGIALLNTSHPDYQVIKNTAASNALFQTELITGHDSQTLINDALDLKVNTVVTENEENYKEIDDQLWEEDIKTYVGSDAIAQSCENENIRLIWNGYQNLIGLKATVFSLKAQKHVILQKDLILQVGHLLTGIAQENQSLIIPGSNQLYFFWSTILNQNIDTISSIQLIAPNGQSKDTLLDLICLVKLIPEIKKIEIFLLENKKEERSAIVIQTVHGDQVITSRNCQSKHPQYFALNTAENQPQQQALYDTSNIVELNAITIPEVLQWTNSDFTSIATPVTTQQDLKEICESISQHGSHQDTRKIQNMQDVIEILTASNRTDLDL